MPVLLVRAHRGKHDGYCECQVHDDYQVVPVADKSCQSAEDDSDEQVDARHPPEVAGVVHSIFEVLLRDLRHFVRQESEPGHAEALSKGPGLVEKHDHKRKQTE